MKFRHEVALLGKSLPGDSADDVVLNLAFERGCVLVTCNRDDFLDLARSGRITA